MARRGVICGGAWCVDRNKLIDAWPAEEGQVTILSEQQQAGGSPANMAIDLRLLGADFPVELVTLTGDDPNGLLLRRIGEAHGVGMAQVRVEPETATAFTDVMIVAGSGRRTFFYFPGANIRLSPGHFDFAKTDARILHLGQPGTCPILDEPWHDEPSGWVNVLKRARDAGLKTNIELASIPGERLAALVRPCLGFLDLAVVNDYEAGAVAGLQTIRDGKTDEAACAAAAAAILASGVAEFVVIHFPLGAIAATRGGATIRKPSVRVPPEAVVGANGAGDAFAAGILFGVHEAWSLDETLTLAHACAAASLRSVSTSGAVVGWRDCMALASRRGWRD